MLTAWFSQTHAGTKTFLKNTYTRFHENSTNGWVADTRTRADRQTWSPHICFDPLASYHIKLDSTGCIYAQKQVFVSVVMNIRIRGRRIMFWHWMIICFVLRMFHCRGKHGCMNLTVSRRYCTCITEHKLDKTGICPPKEFVNIKFFGIRYTITIQVQQKSTYPD
jgi:hypothetical protein